MWTLRVAGLDEASSSHGHGVYTCVGAFLGVRDGQWNWSRYLQFDSESLNGPAFKLLYYIMIITDTINHSKLQDPEALVWMVELRRHLAVESLERIIQHSQIETLLHCPRHCLSDWCVCVYILICVQRVDAKHILLAKCAELKPWQKLCQTSGSKFTCQKSQTVKNTIVSCNSWAA